MSSYAAPGASEATSLVSLLGVAYALGQLTKAEKEDLSQNVVFVLLDGVSNLTVYELMFFFLFKNTRHIFAQIFEQIKNIASFNMKN